MELHGYHNEPWEIHKNYHYGLLTCPTFDMWQGQLKNLEFFHFYSLNFDFNQTLMTAEI